MLKSEGFQMCSMTIDEKVRYGMIAVGGASFVLAALGFHAGPIVTNVGGAGD